MASGSKSSLLGSSNETVYGMKLMRLILDAGTEALRKVFQGIHTGNLQVVLSCKSSLSTCTSFTCNYHCLSDLKTRNIIKQNQWDKLYPPHPNDPNINDFDITLLSVLLRNICGLSPPSTGWDNKPTSSDDSVEADIVRIKLFRNKHFGHIPHSAVSEADFKALWAEISLPLVRLGIDQKDIERLENEECGEEDTKQIWNALENIQNSVNTLVKRDEESQSDGLLKKHLVRFNFQSEIESLNGKCTTGSREWVLEKVLSWFNETTSENRAFVISDHAGMGKSVIAAVICKRFAEHVGASHFFKYNDSQYNNPKFFLQSLAWHLCKVIPAYKEALIQKLSGNLGNPLNDMNIQGLYSVLFKELFSGISDPGKHILIVLDAVDESEYKERDELAELISNRFHELPSYLRFLITTRREKNLVFAFRRLNPLSMQANDKENLNDIKLVLQDKIPSLSHPTPDFIDSLAQKCDGSMLHAFVLTEMYKENNSIHTIDSLPGNVDEYYGGCFKRLERELLQLVGVNGDRFLSFLSALAVAKEPLPEGFLGTLFGFENSADVMDKVAKAVNVLSSLLVIKKDKCISFFHKSIRDWLVDPCREHYRHVNMQYGHKILFDLCVKKLKELNRKGVSKERVAGVVVSYALKYWIPHMLDGLEDMEELEGFVDSYLIDLEVLFATILVDVNVALINLRSLESHEIFECMSASAREMVKKLYSLIGKFAFSLQQYPQTFLQNVVNEGGEKLSSKASKLLQTQYKDIFYFQLDKHDRKNYAIKARCHLSDQISSVDVSPNHDYIVCGYTESGVELFLSETGMSQWKKQDLSLPLHYCYPNRFSPDNCMLPRNIIFHPRENLILPGRLDKVLTLRGDFTAGPFHSDESSSVFSNCCLTVDGSRMATTYRNDLFVWNVSNGSRERSISCDMLLSLSFSFSGKFLGTTDSCDVFSVYDVMNGYKVNHITLGSEGEFFAEIVSTFDHNSWLCSVDRVLRLVSHDLVLSSDFGSLVDVALPSNDHSSRELQRFLQHPDKSWLSKVRKNRSVDYSVHLIALRYILMGDNVLLFSCDSNIMSLFSIACLAQTEQSPSIVKQKVFSNISLNGDFVYLSSHSTKNFTVCKLPSRDKSFSGSLTSKLYFVVVRDGVIFYRKKYAITPELWNSDVTECRSRFDQLTGMRNCLSVSDEVIACVFFFTESKHIIFFNVSTKEIENEMSITMNTPSNCKMIVEACSIKYNVLTRQDKIFLWKDGEKVAGWEEVFSQARIKTDVRDAQFSPNGNKLAISCVESNNVSIFDITSMSFLGQIYIGGQYMWADLALKFFDNENLLCSSSNNMLYSININNCEILTCLDIGDVPRPISVCRERNIVCVGLDYSENFELVTVRLPGRPHTSWI